MPATIWSYQPPTSAVSSSLFAGEIFSSVKVSIADLNSLRFTTLALMPTRSSSFAHERLLDADAGDADAA